MGIDEFFTLLQYVLMGTTFVALVLVFLYLFYGEEEKKS
jgi:hypothetical protein